MSEEKTKGKKINFMYLDVFEAFDNDWRLSVSLFAEALCSEKYRVHSLNELRPWFVLISDRLLLMFMMISSFLLLIILMYVAAVVKW